MTFSGAHAIAQGDVLAVLRELPSNEFDALLCDPPYGFSFMGKKWDYDVPSVEVWREALRVLKPGAPLVAFGGTRTFHRVAVGIEDAGFELRDVLSWMYGSGFPKSLNLGEGRGTALKPAWEPAILARKPLEGTVAANLAKYGTGTLAIDECRIGEVGFPKGSYKKGDSVTAYGDGLNGGGAVPTPGGRWPANVAMDEEAAAVLDAQAGNRPSAPFRENVAEGAVLPLSKRTAGGYSDDGGPSRFFYCAKVSTKEREHGCGELALKSAGEVTGREDESQGLSSPRAGAGRGGGARNHHPTLKPIALAKWLATLIKPPTGGQLLVPFSGAGSEMIGALEAGWPIVFGIEGEQEYIDIAHARIAAWGKGTP